MSRKSTNDQPKVRHPLFALYPDEVERLTFPEGSRGPEATAIIGRAVPA